MAAPAATLLVQVGKKIVIDLFTDPEKIVKFILCLILAPVLIILVIFVIPFYLLHSVPSILFTGDTKLTDDQLQTIALYQQVPTIIDNYNKQWIDNEKKEYADCDSITVKYSYNLTWQQLLAIDSVLLNQDFSKADLNDITNLGKKFINNSVSVSEYKVTTKDNKGNDIMVTKRRAVISVSTKSFDDVLNALGLSDKDKEIAENMYNNIKDFDVEGSLNIYDDSDLNNLKEYPAGSANIPYYNQTDARWGNYSYGSSGTIKTSGCGPTALAMVVAGLTHRFDINPKTVADWSVANGYRDEGVGSYWSLMVNGGKNYGLNVTPISRTDPKSIVRALSQGEPVIAIMGRGHFTNGGHFIVLRGVTSDGKILVYDPVSVTRSNQEWDLSIILNESSSSAGVNGAAFWAYRP